MLISLMLIPGWIVWTVLVVITLIIVCTIIAYRADKKKVKLKPVTVKLTAHEAADLLEERMKPFFDSLFPVKVTVMPGKVFLNTGAYLDMPPAYENLVEAFCKEKGWKVTKVTTPKDKVWYEIAVEEQ